MSTVASTSSALSSLYNNASSGQVTNPNSNLTQSDFLQMLITQLKNQDPSDPVSDQDMESTMAQNSTVSGIAQMDSDLTTDMTALMSMENTSQAAALIGKTVKVTDSTAAGGTVTGVVTAVNFTNGTPMLSVSGNSYGLSSVTQIT
jgi:flagellar basal-body rod modification protein FlgD